MGLGFIMSLPLLSVSFWFLLYDFSCIGHFLVVLMVFLQVFMGLVYSQEEVGTEPFNSAILDYPQCFLFKLVRYKSYSS